MPLSKRILLGSLGCVFATFSLAHAAGDPPEKALLDAARNLEVDFFDAYEAANKVGVGEAELVQARVLRSLMTGDLRGLLAMIEKIEAHKGSFSTGYDPNADPSPYAFSSPREVEGLIEVLKAVRAFQAEDHGAFETHAKNAYWEWPTWPQVFQLHNLIQQQRGEEILARYMENLTLSLETPLRNLAGDPIALRDLMAGHKAVLLDFWASWCGPCIRLMPELQQRANTLPAQGIYVAGVNTDKDDPLSKAAEVKEAQNMDMPWLVESEAQTLSQQLAIDSIPRMVLIAPDGKVLFNGHPLDEALTAALARLDVVLETAED